MATDIERDSIRFYFWVGPLMNRYSDKVIGKAFMYALEYVYYKKVPEIKSRTVQEAFSLLRYSIDLGREEERKEFELKENRKKHGMRGCYHPNWKGGITPENQVGRNSLEYKHWRNSVFARDDYTCQICGKRGGELQAHHLERWSECKGKRYEVNNGMTLCKECHKEVHRRKE